MLTVYSESPRRPSKRTGRTFVPAVVACIAAAIVLLAPRPAEYSESIVPSALRKVAPNPSVLLGDRSVMDSEAYWVALRYWRTYAPRVSNTRYLTIIDYSKPSFAKRLFLIDLKSGRVEKYLVSHGKNSGRVFATAFSNSPETFQSSRGFFVTGRKYCGKHGSALVLHGLQRGINDNAFSRGIVMHGAGYVSMRSVLRNGGRLGRSLGCPAIPEEAAESVIDKIKNGSLLYVHAR